MHTSFNLDFDLLARKVYDISVEAAKIILGYYTQTEDQLSVEYKDDSSPVTLADLAAHRYISSALCALVPEFPVISEEGVVVEGHSLSGAFQPHDDQAFWLVDPLDGTREFISGSGDFSVNIGLVYRGKPLLGVMICPVFKVGYLGGSVLGGAWKVSGLEPFSKEKATPILCRPFHHTQCDVLMSKSPAPIVDQFLAHFNASGGQCIVKKVGSARKFGLIAEGAADLYPRYLPTYEWDTAAAQAIIEAAGGWVLDIADFEPLRYQKVPSWLNTYFIVSGQLAHKERLYLQSIVEQVKNHSR
jgi:3'(2'), 5'-bisphosphate nucleotidase